MVEGASSAQTEEATMERTGKNESEFWQAAEAAELIAQAKALVAQARKLTDTGTGTRLVPFVGMAKVTGR
jgi:hypothetical protein